MTDGVVCHPVTNIKAQTQTGPLPFSPPSCFLHCCHVASPSSHWVAAGLQVQVVTGLLLDCKSSCHWVASPVATGLQVQLLLGYKSSLPLGCKSNLLLSCKSSLLLGCKTSLALSCKSSLPLDCKSSLLLGCVTSVYVWQYNLELTFEN